MAKSTTTSGAKTIDIPASESGGAAAYGETGSPRHELDQVRLELGALRVEHGKLLERQRVIMELIGVTDADRLVHDIRNVLNERELLRTLAEGQM